MSQNPYLRAIEIWLLIIVVETVHGMARVALVEPLIGDVRARQIGVFTGSVLILGIAHLFKDWIGIKTRFEALAVGCTWVVLTIAFEIILGRAILGLGWDRILSDYDVSKGGLMIFGLVVMLFAPLLVTRRGASKSSERSRDIGRTPRS